MLDSRELSSPQKTSLKCLPGFHLPNWLFYLYFYYIYILFIKFVFNIYNNFWDYGGWFGKIQRKLNVWRKYKEKLIQFHWFTKITLISKVFFWKCSVFLSRINLWRWLNLVKHTFLASVLLSSWIFSNILCVIKILTLKHWHTFRKTILKWINILVLISDSY